MRGRHCHAVKHGLTDTMDLGMDCSSMTDIARFFAYHAAMVPARLLASSAMLSASLRVDQVADQDRLVFGGTWMVPCIMWVMTQMGSPILYLQANVYDDRCAVHVQP